MARGKAEQNIHVDQPFLSDFGSGRDSFLHPFSTLDKPQPIRAPEGVFNPERSFKAQPPDMDSAIVVPADHAMDPPLTFVSAQHATTCTFLAPALTAALTLLLLYSLCSYSTHSALTLLTLLLLYSLCCSPLCLWLSLHRLPSLCCCLWL